jgi:hypothetical protein
MLNFHQETGLQTTLLLEILPSSNFYPLVGLDPVKEK